MASHAQIVATIGPASASPEIISQMIAHQMDVARLNFSWGTYEEHEGYIRNIRDAAKNAGRIIPIIQDLSGLRKQDSGGHHLADSMAEVITEKDLRDLDFGLKQGVEYVCLSYVKSEEDILRLKKEIADRKGVAKVIAKVERQEALDNLESIIKVSDGIMLGRGDLANDVPLEKIPFIEASVVAACNKSNKPVIVATQMLLSMVENPQPTRAEVTDIAYAIILNADAVMLSEETARGKYPVEAIAIMEKVILEAEKAPRRVNQL